MSEHVKWGMVPCVWCSTTGCVFFYACAIQDCLWYWCIDLCALTWAGQPNWVIISLKYLWGLSNEADPAKTSIIYVDGTMILGTSGVLINTSQVAVKAKLVVLGTAAFSAGVSLDEENRKSSCLQNTFAFVFQVKKWPPLSIKLH